MPNKRSPDQTLIAFALNRDLLRAMDDTCAKSGESRSTFIRQALVAKIRASRQPVDESWIQAQVRAPDQSRPAARPDLAKMAARVNDAVPRRKRPAAATAKKSPARATRR